LRTADQGLATPLRPRQKLQHDLTKLLRRLQTLSVNGCFNYRKVGVFPDEWDSALRPADGKQLDVLKMSDVFRNNEVPDISVGIVPSETSASDNLRP
jgi:hypothetical protein